MEKAAADRKNAPSLCLLCCFRRYLSSAIPLTPPQLQAKKAWEAEHGPTESHRQPTPSPAEQPRAPAMNSAGAEGRGVLHSIDSAAAPSSSKSSQEAQALAAAKSAKQQDAAQAAKAKRAARKQAAAKKAGAPQPERVPPAPEPEAQAVGGAGKAGDDAPEQMPAGLSKMEQLRWRRAQKAAAAAESAPL